MKAWFFGRDEINPLGDTISQINNNTGISDDLYQQDIILTEEQIDEIEEGLEEQVNEVDSSSTQGPRGKRQALKDKNYPKTLWTGTVNYHFHPASSYAMKRVFRKAAKMWEKDTCVNFTENRHGNNNYKLLSRSLRIYQDCNKSGRIEPLNYHCVSAQDRVIVVPSRGCSSNVGRIGGEQKISLGSGCETTGIAAHEIGHTLGLFHTHSRVDRDDYVYVNMDLITLSFARGFKFLRQNEDFSSYPDEDMSEGMRLLLIL